MKCPHRVTSIYGNYMTDELWQHLIVQTIVPNKAEIIYFLMHPYTAKETVQQKALSIAFARSG